MGGNVYMRSFKGNLCEFPGENGSLICYFRILKIIGNVL